ncbi:hypothetical protein OXYTRIMIC_693 [Oxytricha trifallax]|uniref:Uncharacterized protein n=1 Tax=Oxytricha trifallax TaxID=1172189 RepID=A0A073IAX8_9SPIT|nr:hypothetical protein OXYTRIMIC_693 [Oxytricha trifallax]
MQSLKSTPTKCVVCRKPSTGQLQPSTSLSNSSQIITKVQNGYFLGMNSNIITTYCKECFNQEIMNTEVVKELIKNHEIDKKLFEQSFYSADLTQKVDNRAKEIIANELEKVFAFTEEIQSVDYHIELISMSKKNEAREKIMMKFIQLKQWLECCGEDASLKLQNLALFEDELSKNRYSNLLEPELDNAHIYKQIDTSKQDQMKPLFDKYYKSKLNFQLELAKKYKKWHTLYQNQSEIKFAQFPQQLKEALMPTFELQRETTKRYQRDLQVLIETIESAIRDFKVNNPVKIIYQTLPQPQEKMEIQQ